jgi:apolipoprotein D and lipocalin family protein
MWQATPKMETWPSKSRAGRFLLLFVAMMILASCRPTGTETIPPLRVVDHVDLNRYAVEWYEIARYPHSFQKGCVVSKATYSVDNGGIEVVNDCYEELQADPVRSVAGRARVVDRETNAKLKVTFFWPFAGDYWIIDLDDNYQYAVVGHPKRKYLWILSRTQEMEETVYNDLLTRLEEQSYDTGKLIKSGRN